MSVLWLAPSFKLVVCTRPVPSVFTVARPWCRYSALEYVPAGDTYPCVSPGEAHTAVHESNKWPLARAHSRDTRQSLDMAREAVSSDAAGVFAHYFAAHPDLDCSMYDVVEMDIYPRDLRLKPGPSGARQLHEDYFGQPVVPVKFSGGNPGKRNQGAPVTMKRSDVRARIKEGEPLPVQKCAADLLAQQEQFRASRSCETKRPRRGPRRGSLKKHVDKKLVSDPSVLEPPLMDFPIDDGLDADEVFFAQAGGPFDVVGPPAKGAGDVNRPVVALDGGIADLFDEFDAAVLAIPAAGVAPVAAVVAVATAQDQPANQGAVPVHAVDPSWRFDECELFGY